MRRDYRLESESMTKDNRVRTHEKGLYSRLESESMRKDNRVRTLEGTKDLSQNPREGITDYRKVRTPEKGLQTKVITHEKGLQTKVRNHEKLQTRVRTQKKG